MMERERRSRENNDNASDRMPKNDQLLPVPSSSPPASTSSLSSGYIEHPVSKFDTLAGVAIRYGVEVADIKRLNGLVTDIQMFALKSIYIPLPGRHPPSTCLPNGFDEIGESSSELTPPLYPHGNLCESFQSLRMKSSQRKVSPAMSSLQGFYRLESKDHRTKHEILEMGAFEKVGSCYLEDGLFIRTTPGCNPPLSRQRKSKSLVIDFLNEKGDPSAEESTDKWVEKIVGRRQKLESNFTAMTPEMVLKDDTSSGGGAFSASAGKGLALRSKATIRTSPLANADMCPTGLGDVAGPNSSLSSVRKSSSTSSLLDQEMSGLSSVWPTSKRSLKQDLQSLSTTAMTKPIFDGLPRPLTSRRNKAALD